MNKTALRNFATFARRELITQVKLKAKAFGITPEGLPEVTEGTDYIEVNQVRYSAQQKPAINKLFQAYKEKEYTQLIEEVAYTWFNRLIAIRFMEVHNYLPSRIRVLSSETEGKVDPDILTDYHQAGLPVAIEVIDAHLQAGDREAAYRELLIAQCNELSEILPFLFEKIDDYAALLLPDRLLHSDSVIQVMNRDLTEEDFQEVEVIGWLYQYYIAEKKDEVFAGLKKNQKITKDNIPAATQLFTPHWIVRYMVENSLGHLWQESHPGSELKQQMTYYIEPAEQEEEVQKQLEELRNPDLSPEEITLIDSACGSGHILVYAFDLFYAIYEEQGYPTRDIPALILEKNLYGIDIDKRAAQLAAFALMMKAREKSRRVFRQPPRPNILTIEESNTLDREGLAAYVAEMEEEKAELQQILEDFVNARNYGSILQAPSLDYDRWLVRVDQLLEEAELNIFDAALYDQLPQVRQLLEQAKVLAAQYDIVVTNPPYMGSRGMNPDLSNLVRKNYPDTKGDLFAVFMERNHVFTKKHGLTATINQHSWMFLSSYEKLRKKVLHHETILSMLHLGPHAFEEIGGEVVQSTTYVTRKIDLPHFSGRYYRLVDFTTASGKEEGFFEKKDVYKRSKSAFGDIPGSPIAYWASDQVRRVFRESEKLGGIASPKHGMSTGKNAAVLRRWFEVERSQISTSSVSLDEFEKTEKRYVPYNKGGAFRKWFGNTEFVISYDRPSRELMKSFPGHRLDNPNYYFREGITWSFVSSSNFGVRYTPQGFIFDVGGSSLFPNKEDLYTITAFLCTKLAFEFLTLINPTLNFQVGNIASLPIVKVEGESKIKVESLSKQNISLAKTDWDSFETSWDFQEHPFLTYRGEATTLAESFANWQAHAERQFRQLQANEEELNRIFIELYGLQEELTPEVPEEEVTVRRAERERDAKSFLSYCVGVMMGRYALNRPGLVYAGGEWDASLYKEVQPVEEGIIPLTDAAYFEEDVITRLNQILIYLYGEETLAENQQWLAESLGRIRATETAEERIRRYFCDEFYKDHCRIYQKRPIYWLADSGRKKGIRALIYLHRYQPHTLGTLRFRYVQELQGKLQQEEKYLEQQLADPSLSTGEKREMQRRLQELQEQQEELLQYDQKLAQEANRQLALDLDDGVVENYKKLQSILAKIR